MQQALALTLARVPRLTRPRIPWTWLLLALAAVIGVELAAQAGALSWLLGPCPAQGSSGDCASWLSSHSYAP